MTCRSDMTDQEKIRAIIKKVWTQAEPSPEGKLAGSVIELSLRDLIAPPSHASGLLVFIRRLYLLEN